MNKLLILFIGLWFHYGNAQTQIEVRTRLFGQLLEMSKPLEINGKSYQVDVLKFYLSKVRLLDKGCTVSELETNAFLIDFTDDSTRYFQMNNSASFDAITFTFGIDSATNCSGIMTGALDPINGMYWTWQSGYINYKIEGTVVDTNTKSFTYHLGGYLENQLAATEITLKVENQEKIIIELQLDLLFDEMKASSLFNIMSPGIKAVELSQLLSNQFNVARK